MKNNKMLLGLSGLVVLAFSMGTAGAETAGLAQFVYGGVKLTPAKGIAHPLQKGDLINEGDTINTARNASAQIRMKDGGFIAVRPDTQLKFDSFKYSGKVGQPERSSFSLLKGGFRAVTGMIGRVNKQDYRISTPAATIGIRGTDHETIYLPANVPGAMAGAYSKVNIGETTLTTNKGRINVLPNQMGFAGGLNQLPQIQPINTSIFTVAVAPSAVKVGKENKSDNKEQGGGQNQQATSGDKKESNGSKASGGPEPIRGASVVDNTKLAENITSTVSTTSGDTTNSATVTPPVTQAALPVTASSGGLTLNATAQTVAAGNTTLSVKDGIYSIQAKTAADAAVLAAQTASAAATTAASANTTLLAIAALSTTPATTAIGTATTNIGTVTPIVATAARLTAANAGTAAAAAQTAATTSSTQASAAQGAITANGSFADTTAIVANNLITGANALVQVANTTVQTNAAAVTAQNTALTNAQTAASNALASANSNLTSANSSLVTVNATVSTQNNTISSAQTAAATLLNTAQAAAAAANTASLAAQAAATQAATMQTAGDLTGAAAQLAIAQQQLVIAQTEQANAQAVQVAVAAQVTAAQAAQTVANNAVSTVVSAANTAATAAATAQTQAGNATSAAANASAALATTTSQLVGLTTNAATVAANAPIAAYNNPAVASNNFIGHLVMPAPVTGGYNIAQESNNPPISNTQFVLDGSGNLVEIRSTPFKIHPVQSLPTTTIANADIKWSGGTAAETFKMADNSIYAGRWAGATVTVTDLATTAPMTPFSLTPANSLWTVLLTPGSGYVQSLVGTINYTKVAATLPFDALGNLGTLNTATLSADFTNQLVSAALNLTMPAASSMAGTYAITANNMPINTMASGNGLGGFGGNFVPTVNCSGTAGTCTAGASGYSVSIGGSFAGTAAASAALGYDIWPTTTPVGAPVIDLVQGLVAFNTATAPTVTPNIAYNPNHIAVESTNGFGAGGGNMAILTDLVYVAGGTGNLSSSGALSSMTFRDFGGGSGYVATSTISGGTATSVNAAVGIQYGAWTGYTAQSNTWTMQLGSQQKGNGDSSWMYGTQGYLEGVNLNLTASPFVGTSAGAFTYQMDSANAPQSRSSGLTGTVTSASFTANFSSMLLNGNLAILMPGNDVWGATLANQTITPGIPAGTSSIFFSGYSPGVSGSTLTVTHGIGTAISCATCGGNMSGTFTGQNFSGALLSYNLYDNALGGGDVAGNIAFTRNYSGNTNPAVTLGTPAPTGSSVVATNTNGGGANISLYPTVSTTTGNVLTSFSSSGGATPNTFTQSTTITCPTCTATAAVDVLNTGIYYGNWTAGSITQSYSQTTAAGTIPNYWITGPEAGPLYLPQALTGTATFTFNAGQVNNGMGVAGTILGTTALALDFNRQTVGINLDVSIADTAQAPLVHLWNAKTVAGQEAALGNGQGIGGAGFYASTSNNGGGSGLLTITVDGSAANVTSASGYINGQLTGSGLTGAIMSFNLLGTLNALTAPTVETINGVAAFTGTASNIATPYRYVSIAFYDPFAAIPRPLLGFYANADSSSTPAVGAKMDVNGNLTQFDNQFINNNGGNDSKTFVSNTSTLIDHGSDPVSGISWGRWAGGTFNVTNRVTGVVTPVTQAGSLHWITEPVATSAVTLPTTGTFTYTNAGGTSPTDNLGNVGTLNSATLAANFTSQTVNLGVSATVAGATLNATATNAPIIQQTVFYASSQEPPASTSYLTVACTGGAACGATTGGTVIGKFTGAGAIGAAMTYGLQNGASTISGVTAFHR